MQGRAMTLTDALLFVLVVSAVTLALAVDIATLVGWLRRRQRGPPT
jgi:hypothetical protein